MLPWWGWLALWTVLLASSGLVLWRRGRGVWHSLRALGTEVERSGRLLDELEAVAGRARPAEEPLAVIRPPHRVRAEYRAQREAARAERAERRARRRPPWARVD